MKLSQNLNYSFSMENHTYHILMVTQGVIEHPIPAHSHSYNSYEVHYILEGCGKLIVGETVYLLTPGTLFVTGPGILHRQEPDKTNPMQENCLYFSIDDSPEPVTNAPITKLFRTTPFWYGTDNQNIADAIHLIHQELSSTSIGHSVAINACFQRYLVALARNISPLSAEEKGDIVPFQREIEMAFLYRYRDLTLDDICEIVGMCRRQTQRVLLKYYGCTFQEKRAEARMSAAASFILDGNYTMEEIADLTGYSSLSSFLQAFKAYYHMTTREWRRHITGL
ncbi:helix-turn-helix transcriptional regulator [Konateibacter massiliensis]|uniref:helix-turn-helix transcriptional regulator n=1 Tax=Konateibacter massiliensis TaxID=2002841 RepID=UPI000C1618B3|nr:AraC family transcriptional regulator [Konateibacter massiliensis]